jgi:hypothetical protein
VTARKGALVLALLALLVFASCGDDQGKPIPAATATALNNELNGVQARLDNGSAGACKDVLEGPRGPNKDRVQELIDSMPDDVDSDVRAALRDSFDNLWDLVQQQCDDLAAKQKPKKKKKKKEEPEQTETETETQTETTPTETTPTETTPTSPDEAPLPNDGDGDSGGGVPGNGNGNGVGNGGGVGPGADLGGGE